jgi:hypothetical protein
MLTLNHSNLFNAMIYPFTRTVIYGVIWYQGKQQNFDIVYGYPPFGFLGEQNTLYNTDKYACSFSKLIQYWRQVWNERTNGITDIRFPFGFVQVSFTQNR